MEIEFSHRTLCCFASSRITWLLLVGSSLQSLAKQMMFSADTASSLLCEAALFHASLGLSTGLPRSFRAERAEEWRSGEGRGIMRECRARAASATPCAGIAEAARARHSLKGRNPYLPTDFLCPFDGSRAS